MFDVSHLGTVRLTGPDAFESISGDADQRSLQDRARAGAVHAPARRRRRLGGRRHHRVVASESTRRHLRRDAERLEHRRRARRTRRRRHHDRSCGHRRAGPDGAAMLGPVFAEAAAVGRFRVERLAWNGVECTVAGTGYTGEAGCRDRRPAGGSARLCGMHSSAPASRRRGSAPATRSVSRRGCRCTVTSSAAGITSLQAGLGWVVAWDKSSFRGREAARRPSGRTGSHGDCSASPPRPPACPRLDAPVVDRRRRGRRGDSGNFSPVLGHGIAFAFLPPATVEGQPVVIDVRGNNLPGHVVSTPFVTR